MDDRLKHILGTLVVSIFQSALASDGKCRFKLALPYWVLADGYKWVEYSAIFLLRSDSVERGGLLLKKIYLHDAILMQKTSERCFLQGLFLF